ncbi:hypothetical protein HZP64_17460 [Elizabethkingia anophelis]|uniref:hypothetical protein n=1 Tax=Elizabethkingia anophelis TaxID=1117645 RepID=UPI00038A1303|nr:hypothetical protein [Elizabethkingia anophelis]EQB93060.1 hypothetical protein C874_16865 [Elizabethkingia anophelis 502]MCT4139043.1 hypothetical protein [Elizabethkingia anophelis]
MLIREFKKGVKNIFQKLEKLLNEIFGFGDGVVDSASTPAERRVKEKEERRLRKLDENNNLSKRRQERRLRSQRFKAINEKKIKLYRVQGGEVPNASRYRFFKKWNEVIIEGNERLYVTFKDEDRVLEFWIKRGNKAEVFTADISETFFNRLMKEAVPQEYGKAFPDRPQFGDATKTNFSLGIPKDYFGELLDNMSNIEILKLE